MKWFIQESELLQNEWDKLYFLRDHARMASVFYRPEFQNNRFHRNYPVL